MVEKWREKKSFLDKSSNSLPLPLRACCQPIVGFFFCNYRRADVCMNIASVLQPVVRVSLAHGSQLETAIKSVRMLCTKQTCVCLGWILVEISVSSVVFISVCFFFYYVILGIFFFIWFGFNGLVLFCDRVLILFCFSVRCQSVFVYKETDTVYVWIGFMWKKKRN